MKLLLLFLSISVFANEHCSSEKSLIDQDIFQLGSSGCSENDLRNPCSDCVAPALRPYLKNEMKASLAEIQEKLLKVAFDEYKKVVISNIVDIAKTRSLPNANSDFSEAKLACKVKSEEDFPKGCNSQAIALIKKSDIFNGFNKQMANEIASIVSKKPIKIDPTLLTRNANSCGISEQTLLQVTATVLEETFDPKFISILQKIPNGKYSSINSMLESDDFYDEYGESILSLKDYMQSNPLLSDHISTPDKMINFFKALPQPINPKSLKAHIYNKKNNQELDNKIAKKCNDSFSALKTFVCSDNFAKGNVNVDLKNNYAHLFNERFVPEENPAENYYAQKKQALKYCSDGNSNATLNLSSVNLKISQSLNSLPDSAASLNEYQASTYIKDFSQVAEVLCKNEPCKDPNNINCRFISEYNKIKKENSYESKLANASNDEVNALLRSMIDAPEKLDPKTREVLVAEGILPDSSGKVASTSNIPERAPISESTSNTASTVSSAQAPSQAAAPQHTQTQVQAQSAYGTTFSGIPSTTRAPASATEKKLAPLPDYSDLFSESNDLKRIQDEIRRRISGAPKSTQPKTIEEARKVVRESMNAFPKRPTYLKPNTEAVMAERLLSSQMNTRDTSEDKAAAAAQNEKWAQETHNSAMANMYGARMIAEKNGEAKSNAPGANQKAKQDLTKVALNIPEDAKVNLTEVFGKKYNANDPETQVLKVLLNSKNDFLLQINALDFKVVFDEKEKFSILLQKGNPEEASRLRPQLELFLKRLNEKKSTL